MSTAHRRTIVGTLLVSAILCAGISVQRGPAQARHPGQSARVHPHLQALGRGARVTHCVPTVLSPIPGAIKVPPPSGAVTCTVLCSSVCRVTTGCTFPVTVTPKPSTSFQATYSPSVVVPYNSNVGQVVVTVNQAAVNTVVTVTANGTASGSFSVTNSGSALVPAVERRRHESLIHFLSRRSETDFGGKKATVIVMVPTVSKQQRTFTLNIQPGTSFTQKQPTVTIAPLQVEGFVVLKTRQTGKRTTETITPIDDATKEKGAPAVYVVQPK